MLILPLKEKLKTLTESNQNKMLPFYFFHSCFSFSCFLTKCQIFSGSDLLALLAL